LVRFRYRGGGAHIRRASRIVDAVVSPHRHRVRRDAERALLGDGEQRTEFGPIDANTNDLAKLLLAEFGLLFSNDGARFRSSS
jgi:hypothetical protein